MFGDAAVRESALRESGLREAEAAPFLPG